MYWMSIFASEAAADCRRRSLASMRVGGLTARIAGKIASTRRMVVKNFIVLVVLGRERLGMVGMIGMAEDGWRWLWMVGNEAGCEGFIWRVWDVFVPVGVWS